MESRTMHRMLFFLFLFLYLAAPGFSQQEWPMVNACRERTSWASQEDVLYPPLRQVAQIPNNVSCYVQTLSWANQLLIIGAQNTPYTNPNKFFAVQDATGDTVWTFEVPQSTGSCQFVAAQNDSLVFFGGQQGLGLYAVYRATGQEKWFKPLGSLSTRNPILDNGWLYIVADSLYCLNIGDGATVWTYPFSGWASPAVDESNCYVCGNERAFAFDKLTGEKKWEKYNSEEAHAALAVDDDHVYTQTNDSVVARHKATGEIDWAYRVQGATFSGWDLNNLAVSDSALCFGIRKNADGKGAIYALNKLDGTYRWHYTFDGEWVNSPTIANNVVYIISDYDDNLYGFNLRTGSILMNDSSKNYRYQPIVANHKLYVATSNYVVVFENDDTAVSNSDRIRNDSFHLLQNYPNPFNPATTVRFSLPARGYVTLRIYNISGQHIESLIDEERPAGEYEVTWNAEGLPGGIYLCRLEGDYFVETRKLILQK